MKFIIPILFFTLAFPPMLFAEETTEPPTVMGIAKGQIAPYSGVLLSTTAAAQIFTERNYSFEECKLRIDFEIEKEQAKYNVLLQNIEANLDSLKSQYSSVTSAKDKEIERLSEIAIEKNDYSSLWFSGGVLVGIGLSIVLVYAINEVK
jgi:hypothetical protein